MNPDTITAVNAVYNGLTAAASSADAVVGYIKIMDCMMEENVKLKASMKRRAENPLRKQLELKDKHMANIEEQFKFQITHLNEQHISMVSSYAGVVKEQAEKIAELEEKLKSLGEAMIETKFQLRDATARGSPPVGSSTNKVLVLKGGVGRPKKGVEPELIYDAELTEEQL